MARHDGWIVLKALEKTKNQDSHSAPGALQVRKEPVQQVDNSVIHTNARLISILQRVHLAVEGG